MKGIASTFCIMKASTLATLAVSVSEQYDQTLAPLHFRLPPKLRPTQGSYVSSASFPLDAEQVPITVATEKSRHARVITAAAGIIPVVPSISLSDGRSVGAREYLVCSMDPKRQVYDEEHMNMSVKWKGSLLTEANVTKLMTPRPQDGPSSEEVRRDFITGFEILDDVMQSINASYWLTAGSLIGALRLQGPVPWDIDGDFCSDTNSSELLKRMRKYPGKELQLAEETFGKYPVGAKDTDSRTQFLLVYRNSGLFVLSLRTGANVELLSNDVACWAAGAFPLQKARFGGVQVSVPNNPVTHLRRRASYFRLDGNGASDISEAVPMPISKWSSCRKCTLPNGVAGLNISLDAEDRRDAASGYVFKLGEGEKAWVFKGRGNVTESLKEASCEKLSDGSVQVVSLLSNIDTH